jgi:hypothetical protein
VDPHIQAMGAGDPTGSDCSPGQGTAVHRGRLRLPGKAAGRGVPE